MKHRILATVTLAAALTLTGAAASHAATPQEVCEAAGSIWAGDFCYDRDASNGVVCDGVLQFTPCEVVTVDPSPEPAPVPVQPAPVDPPAPAPTPVEQPQTLPAPVEQLQTPTEVAGQTLPAPAEFSWTPERSELAYTASAEQPLSPTYFKDLVYSPAAQPVEDKGTAGALTLAAALLVSGVAFTQLATMLRTRRRT